MESNEKQSPDLNNVDSNEEIDDEELQELVLEAQQLALFREAQEKNNRKTKRPFPKWLFWLISIVMVFNTFAIIFEVYSIPAIEFLQTSSKLSKQENIATYKKSVVVIQSAESKGTGFSISSEGIILTNYHVVEGSDTVNVYFPEEGRLTADVVHTYPSVDLAVLKVYGQDLPYLELAEKTSFTTNEAINFIGNPLSFKGIANEGTIIDYIQLPYWDVPVVMMQAPVYRGNSGSPVLNRNGLVIGIIFATLDQETYGKVGLFIPIDEFYNQQ
ncbi:serine protease [Sporosarcina sp. E16_8]|uniref:S1C family serine protease n=1 Tax=Sporosarcina sp. E16_8 TaxID=2789295 RepID=UPI001A93A50B|nr:serine protease [Sporosarcina sp. E16_8]MBO0587375.1 trypsin-like peptidase domain-containing protein [Sporosarcina sp. E16_8]